VVGKLDEVVELHCLAAGLGAALDVEHAGFVEDLGVEAARLALAQAGNERVHALCGHEQGRGKRVGADLDEVVALGCAAHEAGMGSVDDHVRVLVRKREAAPEMMVRAIGDHEQADAALGEREARDVLGQVHEAGADALAFQQLDQIRRRRDAEAEPPSLLVGQALALLDRFPAITGYGQWIDGNRGDVAVDANQALEAGELARERHGGTQPLDDVGLVDHIRLGAKQRNQRVLVLERLGQELAHVAPEEVREPVELQARH
jgi:hypothetical protein